MLRSSPEDRNTPPRPISQVRSKVHLLLGGTHPYPPRGKDTGLRSEPTLPVLLLHRPGTLPRGTGMPYGVVPLAAGERILDQVVFTPLHRCGAFPPAHHQALYPALVDRAPVQGAQTPLRPFRNLAAEQTGVSPLELYGAAFPWTQQILGSVLQSGYSQKAPSHSLADGTTDDRRLGKPCLGFSFSQCQGTSLLGPEIPENPVPGRVLRDSFSENSLIAYCLSGIFYLESPLEYSGTVSCALKKGS